MRHLEALTAGVSRRAAIQRTLLPVMLGWFADEADPDGGLLAFRKVSDELGSTHWYLRLLRDEGSAAERLAHTLARSRYAADLLMGAPESVAMLGDSGGLRPAVARGPAPADDRRGRGARTTADRAVQAARSVRRQELFRIAVADLSGQLDLDGRRRGPHRPRPPRSSRRASRSPSGSSPSAAAASWPRRCWSSGWAGSAAGEIGYGSDADVLFVHEPRRGRVRGRRPGAGPRGGPGAAARLLSSQGPDPQLGLDADLRPEGKNGPLVRSLESYRAYYERWSLTWESQALLRARPIAGDADLGRALRRADRPAALARRTG